MVILASASVKSAIACPYLILISPSSCTIYRMYCMSCKSSNIIQLLMFPLGFLELVFILFLFAASYQTQGSDSESDPNNTTVSSWPNLSNDIACAHILIETIFDTDICWRARSECF